MSWWNAKYKNNHGEYEITFASNDYPNIKDVRDENHYCPNCGADMRGINDE